MATTMTTTRLYAEEGTAGEEEASQEEESPPQEEKEEEKAPEIPEDPEVTALKEEIAKMDFELMSRRATFDGIQEDLERYSQAGYNRQVAQMENLKRNQMVRDHIF